jgi:small subunit ribosomal protein S17
LYNKYIYKTSKILAHDQEMVSKVGDLVSIEESKPISKNKSWVLTKVIKAGQEE